MEGGDGEVRSSAWNFAQRATPGKSLLGLTSGTVRFSEQRASACGSERFGSQFALDFSAAMRGGAWGVFRALQQRYLLGGLAVDPRRALSGAVARSELSGPLRAGDSFLYQYVVRAQAITRKLVLT